MLRSRIIALALGAALPGQVARAADPVVASEDGVARAPVAEQLSRSGPHSIVIGGKTIHYHALAGTLTLRDDAGKPTASMFYVAYVADAPKGAPLRPLTFFNNGGPGSASLWLNIGGFGPMRAPTATPNATPPAPYRLEPNAASMLDKSDLVFLDAIGTGYSRTLGDTPSQQFWSVDGDVDSFARGITRYLTVTDRWNSARFLFGESYGTARSVSLAYKLQNQGIDINGVVLLSSILDWSSQTPGADIGYIGNLPSFAAAAWYHGRVAGKPPLAAYLADVRDFAEGPYATALMKGDRLPDADETAIATKLSSYIGLPVDYLKAHRLRVGMEDFRTELLRDRGEVIGRFDARFVTKAGSSTGTFDPATNDPATAGVTSAHLSTYRQLLGEDIGYRSDLAYRALYNVVIEGAWDFHHVAPGAEEPALMPDMTQDLAAAMRRNPNLKVFALNGLFDLATPFFATEHDLSHMFLGKELSANVRVGYYQSGHMTYVDPEALRQMKRDLDAFYDSAAPPAAQK